jgi:predicted membrane-bound mannosyltransferase
MKKSNKKVEETEVFQERTAAAEDEIRHSPREGRDYFWYLCCGLITLTAFVLRFWNLDLKPMHHDEGVNGYFLTTLFREGVYKYDPANYHGPDLYYIALVFTKLFGLNTLSVRWSVAIFGVLTVLLAFYLKDYIGKIGALFAALFLALSPGMVYISRYFIHEMLFVFLSLALVVSILFFIEKRKPGIFAVAWISLILLVCFLPSALNLASVIGGKNTTLLWILRVVFFLVEAVLVYFVVRMILNWDEGRPVYMLLASASVIMLFATKETAFITLGTMLIACVCVWIWRKIADGEMFSSNKVLIAGAAHVLLFAAALYYRQEIIGGYNALYGKFVSEGRVQQGYIFYSIIFLLVISFAAWLIFLLGSGKNKNAETDLVEPSPLTFSRFYENFGDEKNSVLLLVAVITIFIYLGVLFFSSFFTYPEGVKKAFEAYTIWTETGNKDHTQNGTFAYLRWLLQIEAPILFLSLLGALIAFFKARHRFAMFAGLWAFGLFLAYTIIPYKTPWLALSFTLPMCLAAGYAINEMANSREVLQKIAAVVLAIFAVGILAFQTYDLNFERYDDEDMPYVYAHTKRGFLDLIAQIEYYAEKSGRGKDATVEIISPDYWSMPWYLKEYKNANFHGKLVKANTAEMVVAKKGDQNYYLPEMFGAHYNLAGEYPLRPGVDLLLLVRKDLADSDAKNLDGVQEKLPPEIPKP